MGNSITFPKRFDRSIQYRRDRVIPSGCIALSEVDPVSETLSPVLLDESERTLYRLPEVPKVFFYLEAHCLGLISRFFRMSRLWRHLLFMLMLSR